MLAIVAGVIAVAGIFAAYAIIGAGKDITNGNGITVNEQKRGKGTVDTLSFKNPVTIRLIDKDGNVASETVVYNAITDDGKEYIVDALSISGSFAPIEAIRFANTSNGSIATDALKDNGTGTPNVAEVTVGEQTCTPTAGTGTVTCVVTFTFDDDGNPANGNQPYQPAAGATTLSLDTGKELRIGKGTGASFTPYFNNTSFSIGVSAGAEYTQIQITWQITIP
jgi:hypothetical protein